MWHNFKSYVSLIWPLDSFKCQNSWAKLIGNNPIYVNNTFGYNVLDLWNIHVYHIANNLDLPWNVKFSKVNWKVIYDLLYVSMHNLIT